MWWCGHTTVSDTPEDLRTLMHSDHPGQDVRTLGAMHAPVYLLVGSTTTLECERQQYNVSRVEVPANSDNAAHDSQDRRSTVLPRRYHKCYHPANKRPAGPYAFMCVGQVVVVSSHSECNIVLVCKAWGEAGKGMRTSCAPHWLA
jgi:hypothetical protein